MKCDVLIIGGGLAGLALADGLSRAGVDFQLLEARSRLGGRILNAQVEGAQFDLGPAWFWPERPRMDALVKRLGLERFEQHSTGDLVFENQNGQVQKGQGFASMQGSWRLEGGFGALIDTLAYGLPANRVHRDAVVTQLAQTADTITATCAHGTGIEARKVVLATPPRIASQMHFTPDLQAQAQDAMQNVSTWMAGQAKAVAVYDTGFWRQAGLSGDASSRHGPLVEIHDASPTAASGTDGPSALFGFIGVPPQHRTDKSGLSAAIIAQLVRLFGPQAATPKALFVQDWAFETLTATQADHAPLYAHPTYGLPAALSDLWDGRLIFGGTEVATQFGGYLEGALEAAEHAFKNCTADVQG